MIIPLDRGACCPGRHAHGRPLVLMPGNRHHPGAGITRTDDIVAICLRLQGPGLVAGVQLVMSAEVNLAQAIDPKITMYTANENSPWVSSVLSIGMRSIESNASHQCEGR